MSEERKRGFSFESEHQPTILGLAAINLLLLGYVMWRLFQLPIRQEFGEEGIAFMAFFAVPAINLIGIVITGTLYSIKHYRRARDIVLFGSGLLTLSVLLIAAYDAGNQAKIDPGSETTCDPISPDVNLFFEFNINPPPEGKNEDSGEGIDGTPDVATPALTCPPPPLESTPESSTPTPLSEATPLPTMPAVEPSPTPIASCEMIVFTEGGKRAFIRLQPTTDSAIIAHAFDGYAFQWTGNSQVYFDQPDRTNTWYQIELGRSVNHNGETITQGWMREDVIDETNCIESFATATMVGFGTPPSSTPIGEATGTPQPTEAPTEVFEPTQVPPEQPIVPTLPVMPTDAPSSTPAPTMPPVEPTATPVLPTPTRDDTQ